MVDANGATREVARYLCQKTDVPPAIDGDPDEEVWKKAARTERFGEIANGGLTLFDTQAAMLWDERSFYVAFWLEERDVWSTRSERRGLVWEENTVEVFIAGTGAYYNLSVNPMGETEEMFFIWKDAYTRGGRYDVPEFDLAVHRPMVLGGDMGPHHPRGMRWAFLDWRFPGLQVGVRVDGKLNDRNDIDRGWTVEIAFPWEGMQRLADGATPPKGGDAWRIGLARNEVIDQRASRWTTTWAWQSMDEGSMHTPEGLPVVEFCA